MNKENLGPVKINNIHDIKKAIVPFLKDVEEKQVEFISDFTYEEDGSKNCVKLSAISSDVSMRSKLLEGLRQVEEQKKLWDSIRDALEDDEYNSSLPHVNVDDFTMPVDRLIRHRLGGIREGMNIVWYLNNKKVIFDPYSKKIEEIDEKCIS